MPTNGSVFPVPVPLTGPVNVAFQALVRWLKARFDVPRAKVYRSTVQLVGNGVVSAIIWPAPATVAPFDYQFNGTFWNAANPSRLTAPVSGWYSVKFNAQFDINATGIRFFAILHNGNTVAQFNSVGNATWVVGATVSTDIYMAAGEYVEGGVYQSSGGALNISNAYPIWMSIHLIARV